MKETVEQYLARGGTIEKLPTVKPSFAQRVGINNNQTSIMDLDEGAQFFSEFKPKKSKRVKKIDVSALPDSLKFMAESLD